MRELPEQASDGPALEDAHAAALDAFVRYSEAANLIHDPLALLTLAADLQARTFPAKGSSPAPRSCCSSWSDRDAGGNPPGGSRP